MGQAQSNENSASTSNTPPPSTNSPRDSDDTSSSPMGSLLAEAAAFGEGDNENESLEAKAQKALDCPCIADLRNGSCGSQFTEAFRCFLMSSAEEKGSDCVHPFVALQSCIKANPNAFSKEVLEDKEETDKKEEEQQPPVQQDHRIIPPLWAKDPPRSGKSKL
ncbi:Cox19-like CHCH family protein [Raphanus sativus]|uniref:Mitochondrial intermembrane space import and assembly protein 40 homolog n=1 Tax=Raphanus sativus TaxID=3726 RepID=A0A6J0NHP7_RAPSA|nr:mitochondrial intermembrane space import and assembly protein 40 homolog [Raphanus sativus]KAJ4900403.1 Cox19-like CHCH family protein [Raphanus sativus]